MDEYQRRWVGWRTGHLAAYTMHRIVPDNFLCVFSNMSCLFVVKQYILARVAGDRADKKKDAKGRRLVDRGSVYSIGFASLVIGHPPYAKISSWDVMVFLNIINNGASRYLSSLSSLLNRKVFIRKLWIIWEISQIMDHHHHPFLWKMIGQKIGIFKSLNLNKVIGLREKIPPSPMFGNISNNLVIF